jgi:hypothetical protein
MFFDRRRGMYRHIFIIVTACLFFQRQAYSQQFPVDTANLKNAYNELMANPKSPKQQMIFFKLFPSTWLEYYLTYGFIDIKNLNYLCGKHGKAFENLYGSIPDSLYFDKLISISIGGKWDSDRVYFSQDFLRQVTGEKPHVMLARLSKQTKGYQLRFWQFYWSSLPAAHEYKEEHDRLRSILFAIDPEATKIMDIGFEYAWKEYDFQDIHPTLNHDIRYIR